MVSEKQEKADFVLILQTQISPADWLVWHERAKAVNVKSSEPWRLSLDLCGKVKRGIFAETIEK